MLRTSTLIGLVVLLASAPTVAADLLVPAEYATIQAAVDAAESGDTIRVSGGDYPESVTLDRKPGITIRGKGGPVVTRIGLYYSSDVSLRGLVVRGSPGSGIYLFASSRVRIRKCTIAETAGGGIVTEAGVGLEIVKNVFQGIGQDAISLGHTATYATDSSQVRKNRMTGIGRHGVRILRGGESLVEGNTVLDCGGVGYFVERGDGNVVRENLVEDSDLDGFVVATTGNTLEKNESIRAVGDAFHVVGDDNVLTGNEATDTEEAGYQIDSNDNDLQRNRATRCRLTAFSVAGDTNLLTKNKVKDCGAGLAVEGTGNVLTKNKVKRVEGNGFEVSGSGNGFVGNTAKDAQNGFDMAGGSDNSFRGNRASRSRAYDLYDRGGFPVEYVDNDFERTYLGLDGKEDRE